ncbi:MAG: CapA family protein [Spirochaetales bacterium]|nr:CapA family protein [Spirochaetales bacterium]
MWSLFLCGDVMTGRGIDQILPHPGNPGLHESYVRDARDYVAIAEQANGSIPHPAAFSYIWGDALEELERTRPDARIINLETSITTSSDFWPGKGIHYRMHPQNGPSLTAAAIDACCLANNHTLDWGRAGLVETLATLARWGIRIAGAGRNLAQAQAPAVIPVPGKGRVIVVSLCSTTSGVPHEWAAGPDTAGVALIRDLSEATVRELAKQFRKLERPGDILVVSIHWGGNWGYQVPELHREFAHRLIDQAGVDVVHGHSSHHPRPIEMYQGRLVLYGCGDFVNDYEGIRGYERYRDDLALMYLPRIDPVTGRLVELRMVPLQRRRFRLQRASQADARWLRDTLDRHSRPFGSRITLGEDGSLYLDVL